MRTTGRTLMAAAIACLAAGAASADMAMQKKAKELAQLLGSLKSGDKIVTTSGIIGVVLTVKDKTVTIRSADTKLEITKGAVAEITERSGDTAQS